MAKSAFRIPRTALRSDVAHTGIATPANRIETRMSFCIDRPPSEAQARAPRPPGGQRHVLFVTPYLPSPPRFGGQRRLHGLISGVAASHEVSVLSLVDTAEDQTEALEATSAYCRRVVTVPNPLSGYGNTYKRALQLRSLLSSRSFERLVHAEPLL